MKITVNTNRIERIKERMEYWETMLDHPELMPSEDDRHEVLEQWRGAHFILRNLGIEL
jgi:hypothetical protein